MTRLRSITLFTLILIGSVFAGVGQAGVIPKGVSLAPLVNQVSPAVVNISTRGTVTVGQDQVLRDLFGRRFRSQPQERETASLGSGVIVDAANGYLLTNNHVIENADEISVRLSDGREVDAELVGTDERTDVAVLKIEANGLTAIPIGDSEALSVGDYVLAIGNPFGLGGTVTSGIVSAKGRSNQDILGRENYEDFIQTDAAINSGNSGGALINLQGELVGINTAILSRSGGSVGIGFAVPTSMAKNVMDQILEYGAVARGLLGVVGQPISAAVAEQLGLPRPAGALINEVVPDSAAAEAGLREYDVITRANGKRVEDFDDLRNVVGFVRPGNPLDLEIWRDGRRRNVSATIKGDGSEPIARNTSNRVESRGDEQMMEVAGASLTDIPEDHPLFGEVQGVMVYEVPPGSDAEEAQLRPGDIIVSVNRKPVRSLDKTIDELNSNQRNLLKVQRGQGSFVTVLG